MGKDYGPYIVYMISQLIAKQRGLSAEAVSENNTANERSIDRLICRGEGSDATEEKPEPKGEETVAYGRNAAGGFFTADETGCIWRREENVELLKYFCPEGYSTAERHGHFIVGNNPDTLENYIGIPGRFLISEQPAGGKTGFSLWQPLAGGEAYYENPEMMDDEVQYVIFGYWIARISGDTLKISDA